jgi:hypothetical protein
LSPIDVGVRWLCGRRGFSTDLGAWRNSEANRPHAAALGAQQAHAMVVGTASGTLSVIAAIPKATLHRWAKRVTALP